MPPPAYAQTYAAPFEQDRKKQIDRTRTGVLFLLIGALIAAIPYIGGLGSLLILIGAIFVILGRKGFGPMHSRNVILSIVLFFLGIIIVFVGGIIALASAYVAFGGQTPTPAAMQAAFNNFVVVLIVASIVGGLAQVFFTFALQNQTGKMLLLAGYFTGIVISIAIWVLVSGDIANFVATACPGGICSQAAAQSAALSFQARVRDLGLLQAIPSLLFAGAYYIVWNRIKKGEIPGPSMPPGMPQATMPVQPR